MIMCAAAQVLRITLVVLGLLVAAVVRCHGQAVPMDTTISSDNSTSTVSTSASTEAALMTESATSPSPGPPPDPPNSTLTAAVPSAAPTAPTTPTPSPTSGMVDHSPSPKSRALNLTEPPLDDVSMDDDMEDEIDENKSMSNMSRCMPGETFERSCDETCTCEDGGVSCRPRAACVAPYVRPQPDSACHQMPSDHDPCCVLMHCPDKPEGESPKMNNKCNYKNETYKVGETFNDACEATCTCEDTLHVSCKPRCEPVKNTTSDSCVAVPDSSDPCCTVVLCDVSVQDHDVTKPGSTGPEDGSEEMGEFQLLSAIAVNSTSVKLNSSMKLSGKNWSVEVSEDDTTWRPAMATQGSTVLGLEPGKTYHIRVKIDGKTSNAVSVTLPIMKKVGSTCEYKGKNYTRGDEFHDGCSAFCICSKTGVECATIECPTDFGLDVLDPHCLAWETQPSNFVPNPPNCCPETVRCKDNGSCIYAGESFPNWADIPTKLTGCEQRCFCEMGNVTCHAACPPVPANPPADLPCMPEQAILTHPPGEDCCLYWLCPQHPHGFNPQHLPPGFTQNSAQDPNEIKVHTLEAIDESTVRLVFSVPSVLVGLHGRVELRYTADKQNSDPATWEQQVLAPPNDLIATPELEFSLGNLQPDTSYKIKISVILRDLENSPASKILTVKTPSSAATTLPPMIPVQPELQIAELNSTWARLVWRKFTDFELQFIDGVQLRYKEVDGKVYAATPLIHRAVTSYVLEGLKPDSHYEVGIFFIPFPGQTTELTATNVLQLSTAIENDPYKFELSLDVHHIKASSVELSWSGVPYPEDKFVNIFRAIYQSEGGREDFNNFKVAKRDSPPSTLIKGLKPNTRYRIWLEAYLTNGRIKKSNVKDFTTKLGPAAVDDAHPGKLEGMPLVEANDYYGPLIAVSILAALAIVAVLILLLILAKKHGHNKAPITAANTRKVQSAAYDNPSYKVEIQQETMDL
ncbi:putative epidermal cell surface receptor isoform X5 [Nilaparvata lugens]|uniref:putative epidermal cell surface receptor isoform X5 n=1 Tax=Nilaparvata lugens TaxID=108931 RepID=UPI00193D215C|nr:putative epidermal cell surface receptor isoform X5 [Nilaparvata lugens]